MARPRSAPVSPAAHRAVGRTLAAAGLVGLLGGLVAVVLTSAGGAEPQPGTTQATTGRKVAAVRPKAKQRPVKPKHVRIAVVAADAYDPEGDGSENDGDARLATDGDRLTAWKSERYRSEFSKPGVGLVVDAGRSVRASRVSLLTDTPGYRAEIQAGGSADGPFVAVSDARVTTVRTTFVLRRRNARFLMLWITSIPAPGAASVNELTVSALR